METDAALRRLAKQSRWFKELQGRAPREISADLPATPSASTGEASVATGGAKSADGGSGRGPDGEKTGSLEPTAEGIVFAPTTEETIFAAIAEGDEEDCWYICADGLGAARPSDDRATIPAPDWGTGAEEGPAPASQCS